MLATHGLRSAEAFRKGSWGASFAGDNGNLTEAPAQPGGKLIRNAENQKTLFGQPFPLSPTPLPGKAL